MRNSYWRPWGTTRVFTVLPNSYYKRSARGEEGKEEKPPRKSRIPPEVFVSGPLDPEALLRHSREPWAPEAAVAMSGRLQRSLAGHGQDLLAVAAGYGAYFQAVVERRPPSELRRLLDNAEALLAALEKDGESEP